MRTATASTTSASTPAGPWPASPTSERDVTANFTISPLQGTGVVYSRTYREHSAGNFLIINGEDVSHPAASFYLHGTGTGGDGSQIRFTVRGHFILDKRTGQVRRNTIISTCHVS